MSTFSNIFKKSFLEGFSGGDVTTATILVALGMTCILALYIFIVYYLATKNTFYSKTFNIAIALIAVITSGIILAMQSSIVISLGMVGALSIVRFRTAIKDPMDLIFLFWSISIGIICGANMYKIAIIMSLIITIGLFLLELTPVGKAVSILIVNMNSLEAEREVMEAVSKYSRIRKVKSRNVTEESVDMILSVKPADEGAMLKSVADIKGVYGVSLMEHDGEVTV